MNKLIIILLMSVFSFSAQAGDKFCQFDYKLLEGADTAIFYYELTHYEAGAYKVLSQLDCEGATVGAPFNYNDQIKKIKEECKSVTIGNITMPADTFQFQPACG